MRMLTKIKACILHNTPHKRACLFALIFMSMMILSSTLLKWLWPTCPLSVDILLTSSAPLLITLLLYGRVRQVRIPVFYRFKPIPPRAVGTWILFGIGANCFATVVNMPIYRFLVEGKGLTPPIMSVAGNAGEYIIGIFAFALLPAVLEELLCRGIIMREYENYGRVFAVFAAASMFAMLHMSLASFVFTWILGIVLALAVQKTDSIYPAIIVHFSTNFYSLTCEYLTNIMPPELMGVWVGVRIGIIGIFGFGFAVAMLMLVHIHVKRRTQPRKRETHFGFSISFLVLIAIYLLNHIRLIAELFGK